LAFGDEVFLKDGGCFLKDEMILMHLYFFEIIKDSFVLHLDDKLILAIFIFEVLFATFEDVLKGF